ncbi:synaptotagmin-A-like [Stegodyphus dumicola]|uniref:synaptotagmin-A-like n=1 Tax=Stegodyphus dumicola TaxID=202533 RepID=UPI0015A8CB25|nr:synaptotagmin-A-like [Stegodyphus dumicola]XP_035210284.1 synaptotagmin-A-like [Stegodyphus dumicola]XP_035210285.1 synaptotagmin-A-like [Stegodyphus dumicola]
MFQLTENEKIIILSVCIGLLAFTIVVTVCVVAPTCWLHICLKKLAKKRKMQYGNIEGLEEGTYIKLTGTPQYTVECGPPVRTNSKNSSFHGGGKNGRKREDSTYSSMSSSSQGNATVSNYSEPSIDAPISDNEQDVNYGQVTFSVWCRMPDGANLGELIVVLKEAQDLPPRSYGGTCDPYLILQLFRDKGRKRWSKSSSSMLYEFRTTSKKKTQHPIFKETFIMEVSKSDLREDSLKISVFDDEKYANDSELGEVTIPLRELPFSRNGEENITTLNFLEPRKENGDILFGLSYLPTAERLTFNLVKAHNLRITADNIETFAPFIRVLLMQNGKLLKKKKTTSRHSTTNPVFNESLTFDVPPAQLDHVIFLIVASHRDPQDESLSSPDSPTSPPNSSGARKSRHIGKVVIGSSVKGLALNHWKAMKQSPRKQVTQWHTFR